VAFLRNRLEDELQEGVLNEAPNEALEEALKEVMLAEEEHQVETKDLLLELPILHDA
jgi:hypothetical protein